MCQLRKQLLQARPFRELQSDEISKNNRPYHATLRITLVPKVKTNPSDAAIHLLPNRTIPGILSRIFENFTSPCRANYRTHATRFTVRVMNGIALEFSDKSSVSRGCPRMSQESRHTPQLIDYFSYYYFGHYQNIF